MELFKQKIGGGGQGANISVERSDHIVCFFLVCDGDEKWWVAEEVEAAAVGESSNFADGLQAGAVAGLVDGSIDKILVAVAGVLAEPVGVNVGIVAVENGFFGKVRMAVR